MATIIDNQTNGHQSTTPSAKVLLTPSTAGIYHIPNIAPESAKSASDLLQENHVKNHIFFNQSGFHNHIGRHDTRHQDRMSNLLLFPYHLALIGQS